MTKRWAERSSTGASATVASATQRGTRQDTRTANTAERQSSEIASPVTTISTLAMATVIMRRVNAKRDVRPRMDSPHGKLMRVRPANAPPAGADVALTATDTNIPIAPTGIARRTRVVRRNVSPTTMLAGGTSQRHHVSINDEAM